MSKYNNAALLPSLLSSFQPLHPVLWQPRGQYHKTILTQNSYKTSMITMKLVRLYGVKFHVEIFGTPLFQNGTPIFQMGLLLLEKEESRTPTFEIQVRTLLDRLKTTFSRLLCKAKTRTSCERVLNTCMKSKDFN